MVYRILCAALALSWTAALTAQAGLNHAVLDNGLEVYIAEGHSTPLARVIVVFRSGAMAQTERTAGTFHLFEHLMFSGGSSGYANSIEQEAQMLRLGVPDGNAYTSEVSMAFHFSLPAENLAAGLAYWADVLGNPRIDEATVESMKGPLLNEIMEGSGAHATDALWKPYPWRKDVVGHASAIRAATAADMAAIKERYLVPNNAAVLVSGDVDGAAALAAVKAAFGSWERGSDPWQEDLPPFETLKHPVLLVDQANDLPPGMAVIQRFTATKGLSLDPARASAASRAEAAQYLLCDALNEPEGRFMKAISALTRANRAPYLSSNPLPQGGILSASIPFLLDYGRPAAAQALSLCDEPGWLREVKKMAADPAAYLGEDALARAKKRMRLGWTQLGDSPSALIDQLAWFWAAGGSDWALGFQALLENAGWEDLASVAEERLVEGEWISLLLLSPKDYANERAAALERGFTDLSALKPWWNRVGAR